MEDAEVASILKIQRWKGVWGVPAEMEMPFHKRADFNSLLKCVLRVFHSPLWVFVHSS